MGQVKVGMPSETKGRGREGLAQRADVDRPLRCRGFEGAVGPDRLRIRFCGRRGGKQDREGHDHEGEARHGRIRTARDRQVKDDAMPRRSGAG